MDIRFFVILFIVIGFVSLGACAALPKREIITQALLDAPPERVWAVLADTHRYEEWNPFIVRMEGALVEGTRLTNTMQPNPDRQMIFRPKVLIVRPNEELRWKGRLFVPGIFDGEHYFLLLPQNDQTLLIHGEKFSGFGLWFIDVTDFEQNFIDLNEALRDRLEEHQGEK